MVGFPGLMALVLASSPGAQDGEVRDLRAEVAQHERLVAEHQFFSKVDYEVVLDHLPLVFYIQAPKKREEGYAQRVIGAYLEPLRALEKAVVRDYIEPLGLERDPFHNFYAIAILASEGDYRNYSKATRSEDLLSTRAHYNPIIRLAVTYEEPFAQGDPMGIQRKAILHEFVHGMQHAYLSRGGYMPRPLWFTEGLAEYRSTMRGTPDSLANPPLDEDHLRLLTRLLMLKDYGHCLNSIQDLVTTDGPGYRGVLRNASLRAKGQPFLDAAQAAFYAQSSLFIHFLHTGHDGSYKPAFLAYAADVMHGASGWQAFARAFGAVSPGQLEDEFYEWVADQFTRRNPGRVLTLGEVEIPTVGGVVPAQGEGEDPAAEPGSPGEPFSAAALDFEPGEWRLRLAAAVGLAAKGRLEDAGSLLAGAVGGTDDGDRLVLERQRIDAFRELRQTLVETALEKGRSLKLIVDGKEIRGRISEMGEGSVVIGDETVALSAVPADQIATEGRRLGLLRGEAESLDLYAALITGEAPAGILSRLLRGTRPSLQELAAARDEYEELRNLAPGAAAMAGLYLGADDPERARANLELLAELAQDYSSEAFFTDRQVALESWARQALEAAFDPAEATTYGLRGKVTIPAEGRVRIEYDFDGPEELEDFVDSPAEAIGKGRPYPAIPAGLLGFQVDNGELVCVGNALRRLRVPVAAPLTVRYEARFPLGSGTFVLGICDDGIGQSRIDSTPFGELLLVDQMTGTVDQQEGYREIIADTLYESEVRHDGRSVIALLDGTRVNDGVASESRREGQVTLFVHSPKPIRITELTVEGAISADGMVGIRRRWIDRKMQELFPK